MKYFIGCLIVIISASLTAESALFFRSMSNGLLVLCYVYPAILMIGVWVLVGYMAYYGRSLFYMCLLVAISLLTISGAISNSVAPLIEADNISAADKLQISAFTQQISALQKTAENALKNVELLKGQPKNTAWRIQQNEKINLEILALSKAKSEFMASVKLDISLSALNIKRIAWNVALRIMLETLNIFLIWMFVALWIEQDLNRNARYSFRFLCMVSAQKSGGKEAELIRRVENKKLLSSASIQQMSANVQQPVFVESAVIQQHSASTQQPVFTDSASGIISLNQKQDEKKILEYIGRKNPTRRAIQSSNILSKGGYAVLDSLEKSGQIVVLNKAESKSKWVYALPDLRLQRRS